MELVSQRDALATYRYLRIAMPLLVVMLGTSVGYQVFAPAPDCWLGSISAYYYTPARAVFVACLCAIGASLVVYHGNTPREDFALDVAGFMAFVVAFVPTPLKGLDVDPQQPACQRSNVPSDGQLTAAVDNNLLALLVTATFVLAVVLWFRSMSHPPSRVSIALVVLTAVLALGWLLYAVDRSLIRSAGHGVAAGLLFAGIVAVVALNAIPSTRLDPSAVAAPTSYLRWYRVILVLMVVAIVVLGAVALSKAFDHTVFWLESAVIVLFAVFWVVQSKELWGDAYRGATGRGS